MHPTQALTYLGGVADLESLLQMTSRQRLRAAQAQGLVVRLERGRYALPTAHEGLRAAGRLSGVASHATAAALHGWELASQPERPAVIVPRKRHLDRARSSGVEVRFRDLEDHEIDGLRTSAHRTVLDCAKDLPFLQALAIADSALRHDAVDRDLLMRRALALPTNGRKQAVRVVQEMDVRAANPFESALRAIALDVPALHVVPQVPIDDRGFVGRPDLVDVGRRIVIEADSHAFHSSRPQLRRDCVRYNALVLRGWLVLRFTWEQVMFDPEYVRAVLVAATGGPLEQATLLRPRLRSA